MPRDLVDRLNGRGFDAEISNDLDRACCDANRRHRDGELRAIVAAGGDGTIAEIVNRTEAGVPITTLPLGTENLLARHFGIARDAEAVADMVAGGESIQLDVGRATTSSGSRLFLLMVSAGLDAEIIRRLHVARRGNISHWSYIWPILAAAATYRYSTLRIADDGRQRFGRWIVAFNLPCYAGMLRFLSGGPGDPKEQRDADGRFDVCRFDRGGFWHTLYYYVWLLLGRADRIGTRHVERLCQFRLESVDAGESVPVQIDGDAAGYLPVDVDMLPRRLTLLVPTST